MTGVTANRRTPLGVLEEIGFFGDEEQMFGCLHLPEQPAQAAVVICSSTHAELLKAYHLEVLLARELAARGIAVHRFHYRGDGNSDGADTELNLPAMIDAARRATTRLVDRSGATRLAYVGVRMGAFPATRLAAEHEGSPLLLWDPVIDADAFMKDAIRSHAISALKGEAKPERVDQVLDRLEREGSVELLGYELTSAFHSSIAGKHLADDPPTGAAVLIVPFGTRNVEPLTAAWGGAGVDVTDLQGTGREAWWLDEQATEDRNERGRVLVTRSAEWMAAALNPA
ncbi:MAG: alpha/beta hydrolase [Acidimicrobiia bacterium]|nr:alpha/beta hydrolase [Acidimicrobiia bacterium]